jgi:bifunctional non-homologous end joining protein LigD
MCSTSLTFIEPMEFLAVTRLPEGPEWSYEVKLDGYRPRAIYGSRLRLLSWCGKDLSRQFPETYRAFASAIRPARLSMGSSWHSTLRGDPTSS